MSRTITIEHNGTIYYAKVARVSSTHLGTEDHGILTAYRGPSDPIRRQEPQAS